MKQIIRIILTIAIACTLTGCSAPENNTAKSVETIEEQNIKVTVVKNEYHYWYASGCHFKDEIEVTYSDEGISKSFTIDGIAARDYENIKSGDEIDAILYTQKRDNQIISQWIQLD